MKACLPTNQCTVPENTKLLQDVQHDRHPRNFYDLDVKTIDQKSHRKINDRQILDLDFGDTPEQLRGDYLDMQEGIKSEVIGTARFDEISDMITT